MIDIILRGTFSAQPRSLHDLGIEKRGSMIGVRFLVGIVLAYYMYTVPIIHVAYLIPEDPYSNIQVPKLYVN